MTIRGGKEDYFWNRESLSKGRYTWYKVNVDRVDSGGSLQTTFPILSWNLLTTGFDFRYGSVDGNDNDVIRNDKPSDTVVHNEGKQELYSLFLANPFLRCLRLLHPGQRLLLPRQDRHRPRYRTGPVSVTPSMFPRSINSVSNRSWKANIWRTRPETRPTWGWSFITPISFGLRWWGGTAYEGPGIEIRAGLTLKF